MVDRRSIGGAALGVIVVLLAAAPALAQGLTIGRTVVPISRKTVVIERRIVPFDGKVQVARGTKVTVTLDAEVLFDFDKADITAQAQTTLTALADELNHRLGGPAVTVSGYTDALGTDAHNLDLSQRRAAAVRDFLAPRLKVPATFTVVGKGSSDPAAPNTRPDGSDDPEGRRHNRRVELAYTASSSTGG